MQYIPKSISMPSRLELFKNEATEDMNVALLEEDPIIKLNKSFVASLSLLKTRISNRSKQIQRALCSREIPSPNSYDNFQVRMTRLLID